MFVASGRRRQKSSAEEEDKESVSTSPTCYCWLGSFDYRDAKMANHAGLDAAQFRSGSRVT